MGKGLKKLFVSQPMKGLTDAQIKADTLLLIIFGFLTLLFCAVTVLCVYALCTAAFENKGEYFFFMLLAASQGYTGYQVYGLFAEEVRNHLKRGSK
ncbi:MAG: hypothetical protein LBG27_14500 [Spirochaetaceae bacterium]|jgi:hypothetical protein|nr:hypothetical protein [Spirochaetaceae bacterium]